jgi:transcriptional regulator of heat shock response
MNKKVSKRQLTIEKQAQGIIAILTAAGLDYEQMLEVLKMARMKLEEWRKN